MYTFLPKTKASIIGICLLVTSLVSMISPPILYNDIWGFEKIQKSLLFLISAQVLSLVSIQLRFPTLLVIGILLHTPICIYTFFWGCMALIWGGTERVVLWVSLLAMIGVINSIYAFCRMTRNN